MKVGLKYCGGCNPRYDRGALARHLAEAHPEWELTHVEEEGNYGLLLVLCGCPAACASLERYHAPETLVYSSEDLPADFREG